MTNEAPLFGRSSMSFEQFEALSRVIGWKYEYLCGEALITPQSCPVGAFLRLSSRDFPEYEVSSVRPDDLEALVELYTEAFFETLEFVEESKSQVVALAISSLKEHFKGERGDARPESLLMREGGKILAAALLVEKKHGPHLDLLMVCPQAQGQGRAGQLVTTLCSGLKRGGEDALTSAYQLANAKSLAWHKKFGFAEIPDSYAERVRRQFLKHRLRTAKPQEQMLLEEALVECKKAHSWLDSLSLAEDVTSSLTLARILMPGRRKNRHRPAWLGELLQGAQGHES